MKHHGVLYYFIADAIADLRAWWNIDRQIRFYHTRLGHLWIVLDGLFRHIWYSDTANRNHFAEIVYVVYDKNDPSRDHFLSYPGAWDGEVTSNYLIAEYRITRYPVTAGTSNEGLVTLPMRLRQYLQSLYADGGQSIALIEADARAVIRKGKY